MNIEDKRIEIFLSKAQVEEIVGSGDIILKTERQELILGKIEDQITNTGIHIGINTEFHYLIIHKYPILGDKTISIWEQGDIIKIPLNFLPELAKSLEGIINNSAKPYISNLKTQLL